MFNNETMDVSMRQGNRQHHRTFLSHHNLSKHEHEIGPHLNALHFLNNDKCT